MFYSQMTAEDIQGISEQEFFFSTSTVIGMRESIAVMVSGVISVLSVLLKFARNYCF